MISWRYHIVSIVAVVLAFGLGILAGTSVVGEGFARRLQREYDEAVRQRDEALAQAALSDRFAEALQPILRDGRLLGEEAVVVTMDGVDRPAQRAVDELAAAGVDVLAVLELTRRLAEPEIEENAALLEGILGLPPSSEPDVLNDRLADAFAVRLGVGALDEQDDLLGALLAEGLVTADRDLDPDALVGIGGGGQLVVIAAGGRAPPGLAGPDAFLVPFVERLVQLDVVAAAVGPTDDPYDVVSAVRGANGIPDCSMVTVDDIDLVFGGITLAMALDRFLADVDPTFRPGGDYGVRGDAIVPGADEPPDTCRR